MYESSSDNDELMQRVLPVEDGDEDIDFSVPPTSGNEYLRRVVHEAKNCPSIVVAKDVSNITELSKKVYKPTHTHVYAGILPAPFGFAPTPQWQQQQALDFDVVRKQLAHYKMQKDSNPKPKRVIPLKENVNAWCSLCFGRLSLTQTPPLQTVSANNLSEDSESGCSQMLASHGGCPPLLSIVTRMDQPTVVKVLEYHMNWFEKTGFTIEQGRWFYALLACLETPLDPEACSLIRSLARHCSTLRASLDSTSDSRLVPLNLIICLVARYFGQSDLGD